MFEVGGVTYEFHHLRSPTQSKQPGERYSEVYARFDLSLKIRFIPFVRTSSRLQGLRPSPERAIAGKR
jgi:hypothetical protein